MVKFPLAAGLGKILMFSEFRFCDRERSTVPVLFQIPFDCRPTDDAAGAAWKLEVKAAVPGVDYCATFEVPVFKTPQSDPKFVPSDRSIAQYAAPPDSERDLRDAGVVRTRSPAGDGSRFVFSTPRSMGLTTFATASFAICSAAILTLLYLKAPVEVLMQRIQRRARGMETGISLEYLSLLDSFYDDWLKSFDLCPVLTIRTDNLDYVNQTKALETVTQRITDKLAGKEVVEF